MRILVLSCCIFLTSCGAPLEQKSTEAADRQLAALAGAGKWTAYEVIKTTGEKRGEIIYYVNGSTPNATNETYDKHWVITVHTTCQSGGESCTSTIETKELDEPGAYSPAQ